MGFSGMRYFSEFDDRAIDEVLGVWQFIYPQMGLLALLPEAEQGNVHRLQAACARRKVTLVGAVFPALIEGGEFRGSGVWLLRFDEMPYVALHDNLPHDAADAALAADQIAANIRAQLDDMPDVTLFLLFDAMVPNISTLLDELYLRLANRVHYAGANAGSESFQAMPCLFDGARVIQNGVLLMLLKPHRGAILEHGYCVPQHTLSATSTGGNRIIHIDWRPAFEVYRELVLAQFGVEITPENFYQYAVHFPFGIVRANHNVLVRIPVMMADDGSLFCVGEVPPHSVLTLLEAPAVDSISTLEALVDGLTKLSGDIACKELLLFYCAGRRMHLGAQAAANELRELGRRTQAAQLAGALSLGEIGGSALGGYPLFHNATLVAACWHDG